MDRFDQLTMNQVTFRGFATEPLLELSNGNEMRVEQVTFSPQKNTQPFHVRNVRKHGQ